jgi:hypothetical protein
MYQHLHHAADFGLRALLAATIVILLGLAFEHGHATGDFTLPRPVLLA